MENPSSKPKNPLGLKIRTLTAAHNDLIGTLRENAKLHLAASRRFEKAGQHTTAALHLAASLERAEEADELASADPIESALSPPSKAKEPALLN